MSRYFTHLNYSLGDEDSRVEMQLLKQDSRHVLSVAGSGGRVLPLLAKKPKTLCCVDIVDEQLMLCQLRVESIKALDYDEFCGFWGYPPFKITAQKRQDIFKKINLTASAREYLNRALAEHDWQELIYLGKFEKTLQTLSKVVRLIVGTKGRMLFELSDLKEQKEYLNKRFPYTSWTIVLHLLANSTLLNALLYKGDFPQKNINLSTYAHFKKVFDNIFDKFHVRESYFTQMVFLGKLAYSEGNLPEADENHFLKIKDGAKSCDISYVKSDAIKVIQQSKEKFNFISLSDVPSFFKKDRVIEKEFLNRIADKIALEGLVVTRGSLRVCDPDKKHFSCVNEDHSPILSHDRTQLWQIDVYRLKKSATQ